MITDDTIEALHALAIKAEDFDIADVCETALKPIVEPSLRKRARERCEAACRGYGLATREPDYTAKVDQLLAYGYDFTAADFVDLALAAIDQAGLSVRDQERIAKMIMEAVS